MLKIILLAFLFVYWILKDLLNKPGKIKTPPTSICIILQQDGKMKLGGIFYAFLPSP